ncbi:hypothetical protein NDU88_004063 [Pleurodeles waltl]|uniref:Uncharacterized protein n=1 Tax=Pleurodeles waltl TaxID=8319 RepID=A0AAV7RKE5_PLEWA|nr:hypothetical protein NDU88_004063 [Pleurodeles waltl]
MRRLLRILGAGSPPPPTPGPLFSFWSLAELLPRDVEKRRKARERPRKGRRQPESARETGGEKEEAESFAFFACPRTATNGHERPSLIYRPKLQGNRVLGKRGRGGAGHLLPGCCPGWPGLPTKGLEAVDRKGRGMQKLETGQRGYANGRIMRRLLRILGSRKSPAPDARASFFLLSLAELLPRDVEKRRKARERPRKGRRQPESARETGR